MGLSEGLMASFGGPHGCRLLSPGRESGLGLPRPGPILTLLVSVLHGPGNCLLCSQPLTWHTPGCLFVQCLLLLLLLLVPEAPPLPSLFGLRGKEVSAGSGLGPAMLAAQSCLSLCDPMDCGPPGSSVHGISQARILEWAAVSFSRGSSQPRDRIHRRILYH